jgi:hypothetical protein
MPLIHPAVMLLFSLTAVVQAAPRVEACIDFGCQSREQVRLQDTDWRQIESLFTQVDSPAAERVAIAHTIALLEDRVGRVTGTWRDLAYNWQRTGEPGELDCIAESQNTSHYLQAVEQAGLLRWHRSLPRVRRGFFFNPHWTAVIEDQSDGSQWAVDSWLRDNGKPAVIIPLQDWYSYKEPRA